MAALEFIHEKHCIEVCAGDGGHLRRSELTADTKRYRDPSCMYDFVQIDSDRDAGAPVSMLY